MFGVQQNVRSALTHVVNRLIRSPSVLLQRISCELFFKSYVQIDNQPTIMR